MIRWLPAALGSEGGGAGCVFSPSEKNKTALAFFFQLEKRKEASVRIILFVRCRNKTEASVQNVNLMRGWLIGPQVVNIIDWGKLPNFPV